MEIPLIIDTPSTLSYNSFMFVLGFLRGIFTSVCKVHIGYVLDFIIVGYKLLKSDTKYRSSNSQNIQNIVFISVIGVSNTIG